ncbi:hypothetical protein TWF481_007648 [Arthrobotrys musiformis]|uniref:F-box domain-containing protein n=1 Tax=Arthrobotrys musiformis TaxID=47236 RepID=A0AAV9WC58_9PEZI
MPNFLTLPLELRLKIYSYLLTTPPPRPSKDYLNTPRRPKYKPFSIPSTAILRVNKQIHEEAARVLYSNEFVVWITIVGEFGTTVEIENGEWPAVMVWYSSPWEGVGVRVEFDGGVEKYTYRPTNEHDMKYYTNPPFNGDFDPSVPRIEVVHRPKPLPQIYARHIKHLKIEIFEERITPDWIISYQRVKNAMMGYNPQFLLRPVFGRLERLLEFAVGMEFEGVVYPALTADPREYKDGRWDEQTGFAECAKVPPTVKEYEGLIRTIWPLTRGKWRWRVEFPKVLGVMFGDIVGRVLEECDEYAKEEGGTRGEGELGMRGIYIWVRLKGRVVVVIKTLKCSCGK